jgi:hypothetical protein
LSPTPAAGCLAAFCSAWSRPINARFQLFANPGVRGSAVLIRFGKNAVLDLNVISVRVRVIRTLARDGAAMGIARLLFHAFFGHRWDLNGRSRRFRISLASREKGECRDKDNQSDRHGHNFTP